MTIYKDRDVRASLKRKGFKEEPTDHNFYFLYVDGKRTTVNTHTSFNHQDINDYLIDKMKKQLHLSKKDFARLIECPLKYDEYVKILKEANVDL